MGESSVAWARVIERKIRAWPNHCFLLASFTRFYRCCTGRLCLPRLRSRLRKTCLGLFRPGLQYQLWHTAALNGYRAACCFAGPSQRYSRSDPPGVLVPGPLAVLRKPVRRWRSPPGVTTTEIYHAPLAAWPSPRWLCWVLACAQPCKPTAPSLAPGHGFSRGMARARALNAV